MYLRRLDDYNHHTSKNIQCLKLIRIIFFTLVLIFAIMFSSLTEGESSPLALLDSLNRSGTVYFDFGKYDLKDEGYLLLERLAGELKSNNSIKVEITGHTDNIGSEGFNDELSLKRAEAVKQFLIQKGVNEDQVIINGVGYKNPVTDNSTEQFRAMNRRVEFKWISQQVTKEKLKNESDETFVNTGSWKTRDNELTGQLSVRDSAGEPITDIQESDVSAVLKWKQNDANDSTDGTVKLFPIDDKKKIAFTFTMDYSGSMYEDTVEGKTIKVDKVKQMEKAVWAFIDKIDVRHFVKFIKFGDNVDIVQPFTRTKELMYLAVKKQSYNRGYTALFKSIYFAIKDTMYNSNPTIMKTVIAFTDGEENMSGKINKDSVFRNSDNMGIRIFTVGLISAKKHSNPVGINSRGEADLVEIAKRTGGFYYWAKDPTVLTEIYKQIYDQIMKSYNISIMWNGDKLPPKGTPVTAVVSVNVKGMIRTLYKNYVME